MKRVMRLGVVGGSHRSAVGYTHIVASQMDHRFTIESACFSRDIVETTATIEAWNLGAVRCYEDWSSLLEGEVGKVDAILVLTPTPTHFEIVKKALSLQYPVICEKAFTATASEAWELESLRERVNGFIAVTHNYTGYPAVRELSHICRSGGIGDLVKCNIEMPQEGFIRLHPQAGMPTPQSWRLSDGPISSLALDLGTHVFHMLHYVSGQRVTSVVSDESSAGFFNQIVDDIDYLVRLSGGAKGQVWISKSALGHRNGLRVEVYGTKGSAMWAQDKAEYLELTDEFGTKSILDRAGDVSVANLPRYNRFKPGHPAGFLEAFANLYGDFADALNSYFNGDAPRKDWTYGPTQAAEALQILESAAQTVERRTWAQVKR